MFHLTIICGGPSLERGISLNSARSVLDHLKGPAIDIQCLYVSQDLSFHKISTHQLYSNTPSDFDFKLHKAATPLTEPEVIQKLQASDLVFPVIHGSFGEDGTLQTFLEAHNIPFVGSSSAACQAMFDKHKANQTLEANGYHTLPSALLTKDNYKNTVRDFWNTEKLQRAIIKPTAGGSSIGVSSVGSSACAIEKVEQLLLSGHYDALVIEPFCSGREFTVCILENPAGEPVALIPSEIETCYKDHQILDYRRKYLPTGQVEHYCPPRFEASITEKIRNQAESIFKLFKMRGFVRIDGWLLPDNEVWFCDINPISGMEQNSFLFQQAARCGLTHRDLLAYIVQQASPQAPALPKKENAKKTKVHVLLGGTTAERQVSLMSGTNAWLKLLQSERYAPTPYLLAKGHTVYALPYDFSPYHTVEEIAAACKNPTRYREDIEETVQNIRSRLSLTAPYIPEYPTAYTLEAFLAHTQSENAFLFLGLHGGSGEDGTLQTILEANHIPYNGSGPEGSSNCMDKHETANLIAQDPPRGVSVLPQKTILPEAFGKFKESNFLSFWEETSALLGSTTWIIKPNSDGCSTGVVRLESHLDLQRYLKIILQKSPTIAPNTFKNQPDTIEIPDLSSEMLLLEPCIETDILYTQNGTLCHERKEGWLEMTIAVLECMGKYHALNPSITIAQGAVLSIEEKFQGGTGVNITPPPSHLVSTAQKQHIQKSIEAISARLSIRNYARLDFFFNTQTDTLVLIEANSLPALTPSTVLFHQALAESPPMEPKDLFELLIDQAVKERAQAPQLAPA